MTRVGTKRKRCCWWPWPSARAALTGAPGRAAVRGPGGLCCCSIAAETINIVREARHRWWRNCWVHHWRDTFWCNGRNPAYIHAHLITFDSIHHQGLKRYAAYTCGGSLGLRLKDNAWLRLYPEYLPPGKHSQFFNIRHTNPIIGTLFRLLPALKLSNQHGKKQYQSECHLRHSSMETPCGTPFFLLLQSAQQSCLLG